MAAAVVLNTVEISLELCGVPLGPLFDGETPVQRVANQVFNNSFDICLDILIKDVKDALVSFTKLTAAQGKIPFQPGVKRNVIAFVQWTQTQL